MNISVRILTSLSHRRSVGVLAVALALVAGGLRADPPVAPVPAVVAARAMEPKAETRRTLGVAPTSAMDLDTALRVGGVIASQVKGARVMTVAPTGSMRPVLDGNAVIVLEPTSYADLQIGDIITYEHPALHQVVVHRILEKCGDDFWTKGDHNDGMDNVYVTPDTYLMRVFAIIYTRSAVAPGLTQQPARKAKQTARRTS